MDEQREPDGPRLYDADGNPVGLPAAAGRAFAEIVPADPAAPPALWWSLSRPDGGVHVRVSEVAGRWIITDVYIHGRGLTATDLQAVPLTRLDLTMNLLGYGGTPAAGGDAVVDPSTISDVINEYAAGAGYGRAVTHNLDDDPEPSLADLRCLAADAPPELPKPPAAERTPLTRPDGTDPDGFADRVAAAYREYASKSRSPALAIANEAGVPIATVRSWIREARRRGKLPQGHRGKAG